jgi:hypothetical protein
LTRSCGPKPGDQNAWEKIVEEHLLRIAERLQGVQFYHADALDLIKRYDELDTLQYLDPPYPPETRTARDVYIHEMSFEDHERLLETILSARGMVAISSYHNPLYDRLLASWKPYEFLMPNHSGQGKTKQERLEVLWLNPLMSERLRVEQEEHANRKGRLPMSSNRPNLSSGSGVIIMPRKSKNPQAGSEATGNGRAESVIDALDLQPAADPKPPTADLLSAARRAHNYKREGRGLSRQLDVQLLGTPPPGIYFMCWPNPDDEEPVTILRVKSDSDRKELFLVSDEIARLPYVVDKVREGFLALCITSIGRLFCWARTTPDPADRLAYRTFDALQRAGEMARKKWILLNWDLGVLSVEEPRQPIEQEPAWPTGQSLREIYNLAIKDSLVTNPEHAVIRKLDTIRKEI